MILRVRIANKSDSIRLKTLRTSLCACVLLSWLSGQVDAQDGNGLARYDPVFVRACGPVNLYLALRLLGKSADFEDVYEDCGTDSLGHTNFAALREAAEKQGARVCCARMNILALRKLKHLAILHFIRPQGGHFVVFKGHKEARFEILDATLDTNDGFVHYLKAQELHRLWDKNLMILSSGPIYLRRESGRAQTILVGMAAGSIGAAAIVLLVGILRFRKRMARGNSISVCRAENKCSSHTCALILWVVIFAVFMGCGCEKKPLGPSIAFEPYTDDYGLIPEQDRVVRAEFGFRNAGSAPLRITKAQGTCTCKVSPDRIPERDILPGQSDKVVLVVEFAAREGRQNVEIYVHSNDPEKPVSRLNIAARVQPDLMLNTTAANLGEVRAGKAGSVEFELRVPAVSDGQASDSIELSASSPMLSTNLMAASKLYSQLGELYVLKYQIRLVGQDKCGAVNEVVTIRHTKTGATRKLQVFGRVIGNLKVEPETLFFGVLERERPARRVVRLSTTRIAPLEITNIECTTSAFSVRTTKSQENSYVLAVEAQADHIPNGFIQGEIVIQTNDSLEPIVRIPVRAMGRVDQRSIPETSSD